jgi:hypothetical protein
MELKTINLAIAMAMGETYTPKPVNYMDDGPQEARFIKWADAVIQEMGLSQTLAGMEVMSLGDHSAARWRFSVLQLWQFLPSSTH